MSYIPSWVAGAAGGGHYPAHMLPPQHTLVAHQHPPTSIPHQIHTPVSSAHSPASCHSPHPPATESHISQVYQALSSKSLVVSHSLAAHTNGSKNSIPSDHNHHQLNHPIASPPPIESSSPSVVSVVAAAVSASANSLSSHQHQQQQQQQQQAAQLQQLTHPPPSSTPSHPPPANTPQQSHQLENPYEPQGFHRDDVSPPPKLHSTDLRHDLASQLHSLPELALGIPGTSASAEMKAHRKYVRR